MRIFVAGASGVLGRSLVPKLVAAGHEVTGTTRSAAKKALITQFGAEAVVVDGLDAAAVDAAVAAAKPEVVIHEMTDLAGSLDLRHFERAFAASNRLRTEGTDHLLAAARATGVRRVIAQSYCGWPYARAGAPVKIEADPLDVDPPAGMRSTLDAIQHVERAVCSSADPEGIVLRYGTFYGPGTGMLDDQVLDQVRRRRFPLIGNGQGWWSFVHVHDAADATVLAVERGVAGEIYNVVDDEPAPVRDWLPALAETLGARPPAHVPSWIARFLVGEPVVVMMTEQRAGSNAKAKSALGWQPKHASWRTGFADILGRPDRRQAA